MAEETQAETPEPVEETAVSETTPDAPESTEAVAEAVMAAKKARKAVAKKRAAAKCGNHPHLDAVLVTDRGGRTSEQRFCEKCAAKLPDGYAR